MNENTLMLVQAQDDFVLFMSVSLSVMVIGWMVYVALGEI